MGDKVKGAWKQHVENLNSRALVGQVKELPDSLGNMDLFLIHNLFQKSKKQFIALRQDDQPFYLQQ